MYYAFGAGCGAEAGEAIGVLVVLEADVGGDPLDVEVDMGWEVAYVIAYYTASAIVLILYICGFVLWDSFFLDAFA